MSPRLTWVALPAVAALLVAGCGGGGDEETSESTAATTVPPALTMAELIEQGDAICAEVNAAVGTIGTSNEEGSGPAAQAAGLYSGMVASLQNLGTPHETAGYAEFSGAAEELAKTEGEVKLAAEREDVEALVTAESNAAAALAAFQEVAEDYGFEECSEGPSAPLAGSESGTEAGGEEGGLEATPETVEPETVEPEAAPEPAPETGGGAGAVEGGGTGGGTESGGGGGSSGGIGPG